MAGVQYTVFPLIITFLVIFGFDTSSAADKLCPGQHFNLLFVIDSSGSIGEQYFPENVAFVRNFISYFEIGEGKTEVALITFGSSPRLIFNRTGDKALIDEKLKDVPYQGSQTYTGKAFKLLLEKNIAGDYRKGVVTVVILVTDGKSSDESDTSLQADRVKGEGHLLVCVGVGKRVKWSELETVASGPAFVYKAKDYTVLASIAQEVSKAVCDGSTKPEPTIPPTPEPVTTTAQPVTPRPPEPETTTTKSELTPNKPCPGRFFDLVFVIDSSSSIAPALYPENFDFIARFLEFFEIGEKKTRVALITFGSSPRIIFNNTGDETLIDYHLTNTPAHQNSTTQTGKALRLVVEKGLTGERRPGVTAIIYLVTDGKSTDYLDTIDAAELVKSKDIVIVCIGVGDRKIDWAELETVATRPEYVIRIDSYEVLENYADSISKEICNVEPPGPVTTTTIKPPTPEITTTTEATTTTEPPTPEITTTTEATTTTEPPTPGLCNKHFNLIFVIDSSSSIGANNYPKNFDFVRIFLTHFQIGNDKTKVSLITFGTHPRRILKSTGDEKKIDETLKNVPFQKSSTQTGRALNYVDDNGLAGAPRPGVDSIVILVTDGKSTNKTDTELAADRLKAKDYKILCVGVGRKVLIAELEYVASEIQYVFLASDYGGLTSIADDVSMAACNMETESPTR